MNRVEKTRIPSKEEEVRKRLFASTKILMGQKQWIAMAILKLVFHGARLNILYSVAE